MNWPNFFLIGAPRCGSTAMTQYLQGHPQVFMPTVKEPHFFAEELEGFRKVGDQAAYARLFESVLASHSAIGEASVYYLYFPSALRRIVEACPDARALVMLRNPVDLVHSLHEQLLATFHEDEPDFQRAWSLQESRAAGKSIPPECRLPLMLQYAEMGRIGNCLREALQVFPREQIHAVLYDDLVADTRAVYLDVLRFLGLDDDGRDEFPRVNQSRKNRLRWLSKWMNRPPAWFVSAKSSARRVVGEALYGRLTQAYLATMTRKRRRPPLSDEFRHQLSQEFEADIELLESLLGRDLSSWRTGDNVCDDHAA